MKRTFLKRVMVAVLATAVGTCIGGCATKWEDVGDIYTDEQVKLVNVEHVVEEETVEEVNVGRITFEGVSHEANPVPADAVAFSKAMRLGWNLAHGLESEEEGIGIESEATFGQPKITQELISYVRDAGFTTIRIPVTWHNHMTDGVVDAAWMSRVKEVVDWSLGEGFYVILNSHGDQYQYYPTNEKLEEGNAFLTTLWTQIAEAFKDYDDHLVFEGMDAPRLAGTDYEWFYPTSDLSDETIAGRDEAIACVNVYNQTFIDTVRSTGGKNENRYLIMSALLGFADYATETDTYDYVIPTDTVEGRLMLGVHGLIPKAFCVDFDGYSGWRKDRAGDLTFLSKVDTNFLRKGYGVVVTECAATNKDNLKDRAGWAKDYCFRAELTGLPFLYWDNGEVEVGPEQYGLIDREKLSVHFIDILDAMKSKYE